MNKNAKIYIAGHKGLIGSAFLRKLSGDGYSNIVTADHSELDLCDQAQVKAFFEREKPEYVIFAAGKVGGVFANSTYRADFIYENVMMQSNVIHCSFLYEVKKLLFISSADVYPRNLGKPVKEEALLSGSLEATCEPFALAKIAGMKMCESYNSQYGTDFIVVVAPNVYGPNQRYDMLNSIVLPSLIKRFHEAKSSNAKEVVIWGTGKPIRDFLYADDLVSASLFLLRKYTGNGYFNVGTGHGYTILGLANTVKKAVGFKGKIVLDRSKPDGVPIKLLNVSKIKNLGWSYKTKLIDGVRLSYHAYLAELRKKEIRAAKIHIIKANEKDVKSLSKLKTAHDHLKNFKQPVSYKNRVVLKPWGYEFLVFENAVTAVWMLFISKGNSTSMHCHPDKKTSLIILSGTAMSNTLSSRNYLKGGDALIMQKCVFHATKVLSPEGMFLLEIESPPIKTDLVRLEDKYGREKSGYEGLSDMKATNLSEYKYFTFEESPDYSREVHETGKYAVLMETFPDQKDFKRSFRNDGLGLYTLCKGKLFDKDDNQVLGTGETQKADFLLTVQGLHIKQKVVLMKTYSKDKK